MDAELVKSETNGKRITCVTAGATIGIFLLLAASIPTSLQLSSSHSAYAASGSFIDSKFVGGLSSPTTMEFAPDGRLFVAEQSGALRVVATNGVLLSAPFLKVTTTSAGERGLIGIAFDPNFTKNGYIYVHYTALSPTIHNRVSRFTADPANPNVALARSELPILNLETLGSTDHNGGALHFGNDGKLYVAVGNNEVNSNSQSLSTRLGKILRINSDGSIPSDNPFSNVSGAKKEIWALGLRNPFTFAFDAASTTNKMYINDVGENTWEEVDPGIAGANYGWPTCEGACSHIGFTNPIYAYNHNGAGAAITGGVFYESSQFPAEYKGSYFFADDQLGFIRRITPTNSSQAITFLTGLNGAPVDADVGNNGSLYYLSYASGEVHQVKYSGSSGGFPVRQMSDTTTSGATSVYSAKQMNTEFVTGSSVLAGKQIDSITVKLSKAGNPTGNVQIGVFNADLSVKQLFGTKDAATLTTAQTDYTFQLSNNALYTIQSGDYIGVKFTGGDANNYILVMRDWTNSFDGTNSYRAWYSSYWNYYTGDDLYMILKQTHG